MRFYYTPIRITITNSYNVRVDKDMKKLEILYCYGMKNGTTTLEVSYKFKHMLNIRPSNCSPRSLPKKNEWNDKDLCTNVHISVTHKSLKLETT